MSKLKAYIKLMRPHQWIKNGFVFAGLVFSESWHDLHLAYQVIVVALAFSLLSSSIYIINDIADRESDSQHPKKRHRPIAAGRVGVKEAMVLASLLFVFALGLAWGTVGLAALVVLAVYFIMNLGYSFGLKHVVILDVFLIAAGFMLRILAGTVGVGIEPSNWLLMTGMMITLFLGFTKRRAEMAVMEDEEGEKRRVLAHYDERMLDVMIAVTAAAVVIAYSLYTMSPDTIALHGTADLVYTTPLILYGMFRYLYLLYIHKAGEDPAGELLKDRHILVSVVLWLGLTISLLA
ncbi:MAG: decaprenyl-phosphate phosphoribosyltransferase [Gammaproteobacteria bacterium]|nr:decaprenyl-phosphate phosphoribosyltransferase [Gammaproteobacteria bacterium]